jgi:hypothetical protein
MLIVIRLVVNYICYDMSPLVTIISLIFLALLPLNGLTERAGLTLTL